MSLNSIIGEFIDACKDWTVAVIGETITDEFVYVIYEGQSMKSVCPVFKLTGKREVQQGGAAAIANHLKDFVKKVDLFTSPPDDIVKTRYVDIDDKKKHVEINKFVGSNEQPIEIDVNKYDIVIIADFGHGFCNNIKINDGFHLMCQTNSNNFGFNRISKWKGHRKKSVCIDIREASLQMNKKANFDDKDEVRELFQYELNAEYLFITLGSKGSLLSDGTAIHRLDSFKSEVVDTIGAGDTYFAFACLATKTNKNENILVVPSLAASLSTTWMCNERSVTKKSLIQYASQFI
jgi:bifunctional ADP-heptose synthase (sugar kinase/adenylyltransferase)